MLTFSSYILPCTIAIIVVAGLLKSVPVFDSLCSGAKDGLDTIVRILAPIVGIMVAINMFSASGALDVLAFALRPITKILNIPKELTPIFVLRPISGSGSMAVLQGIIVKYGVDSTIGRMGAIMAAATDTTFYTIALYYGSVKIKKTRYTVAASMTADIVAAVLACAAVRMLF